MPHPQEPQEDEGLAGLVTVPLEQISTEDLYAMDESLKGLIEYRVWPESQESFQRARKSIGTELLRRSL